MVIPSFGQAAWFWKFHSEQVDSAKSRYKNQVTRVLYVLDKALDGKKYLVGDKCTIADLSFVTWDTMIPFIFGDEFEGLDVEKKYPNYLAWMKGLKARESVRKVIAEKQAKMSQGH